MLTIEDLFAQPDNAPVLQYLGVRSPADVTSFAAETDNHALDEGGQIFFHTYGRRVPAAARCRLGIVNLLVHDRTARIFAVHRGRLTIALRRDLTPYGGNFFGGLIGYTMDGNVDMSALGPGWVLFNWNDNEEDEDEPFWLAYVLAGR
jgi:hypothetical protein